MTEKKITSYNDFVESATVEKVVLSENQASTREETTIRQQVTDGSSERPEVKRFGGNVFVSEHGSTSSSTIVRSHSTSGELNFSADQAFSYQQTAGGEIKVDTTHGASWEMNTFSKDSKYTVSRQETSISKVYGESQHNVTQISSSEETSSKVIELGQIIAKLEGEKKSVVQSYQSRITGLETQCNSYKHDITTLECRIVALEEENAKLKAEMKAMTDRFQATSTELEVSVMKHETNSSQYNITNVKLEGKINILERNIALLESEKKSLVDSLQEKTIEQNVSTTKLTQECETKIVQYEIKNGEFKEKIDTLERDIAMLEVENKTLTNSLQANIMEHNVSTTKLTQEYEAKICQYEIMKETFEGKIDVIEREMAMLEIEKKNLASSLQEIISEHNISTIKLTQEYETKLGQCGIKTEELEGEIDKLERNLAMLEIEKKSLANALQQKTLEHDVLTKKITQEYEAKIDEYKNQIEKLEKKVDMLEKDIAKIETEKKALAISLQEKITENTISITKLTQEYEIKVCQYKIEVEVFQDKIRDLDGNITRLEDEKKSILDSHQAKIKEYEVSITKLTQDYEKKIEQYKVEKNTQQVRMEMLEKKIIEFKNENKTEEKESKSQSQISTVMNTHLDDDKADTLQMNNVEQHVNDAGSSLTTFEKERMGPNPGTEEKSIIKMEEMFQERNTEDTTAQKIKLEQRIVTSKDENQSTVRSYQTEIMDAKEKSVQVNVDATQEMKKSSALSWSSAYGVSREEISLTEFKEKCHHCHFIMWRNTEELKDIITKMEQIIATIKSEKESVLHLNESITDYEINYGKHEHSMTKHEGRKDDKADRFIDKLKDDKKETHDSYQIPDSNASVKKLTQDYEDKSCQSRDAVNILQARTKLLEREFNELEYTAKETVNKCHNTLLQMTLGQNNLSSNEDDTSKMAAFNDLPIGSNNFFQVKNFGDNIIVDEWQYLWNTDTPGNLEWECTQNQANIKDLEQEYIWNSTALRNCEWGSTSSPVFITDDEQKQLWSPTTYWNLEDANTLSSTNRYLMQEEILSTAAFGSLVCENNWIPMLSTITVNNLEWENTWSATRKEDVELKQEWNTTAVSFLEWEQPLSPTLADNDLDKEKVWSTTSVINSRERKYPWKQTFDNDLEKEQVQGTTAVANLEDPWSPTHCKTFNQKYLRSTTSVKDNLEWEGTWSQTRGKDFKQEHIWSTATDDNLEWRHIGVPAFNRDCGQKQNGSLTITCDLTTNSDCLSLNNQTSNYSMTNAGVLDASSTQKKLMETETIGRVISPLLYTVSYEEIFKTDLDGKCHQYNLKKIAKTTEGLEAKISKLEQSISELLEGNEKMLHYNSSVTSGPKTKCVLDNINNIVIMDSQPKKITTYRVSTTNLSPDFAKNNALQTNLTMLDEHITNTKQDCKGRWKDHGSLSQITKSGDIHFNDYQLYQTTNILIEGQPYNFFTITAMGTSAKSIAVELDHISYPKQH